MDFIIIWDFLENPNIPSTQSYYEEFRDDKLEILLDVFMEPLRAEELNKAMKEDSKPKALSPSHRLKPPEPVKLQIPMQVPEPIRSQIPTTPWKRPQYESMRSYHARTAPPMRQPPKQQRSSMPPRDPTPSDSSSSEEESKSSKKPKRSPSIRSDYPPEAYDDFCDDPDDFNTPYLRKSKGGSIGDIRQQSERSQRWRQSSPRAKYNGTWDGKASSFATFKQSLECHLYQV